MMAAPRNPNNICVRASSEMEFEKLIAPHFIDSDKAAEFWSMHPSNVVNENLIVSEILEAVPEMKKLAEHWPDHFERFRLSTAGIIVGHVNCMRVGGFRAKLDIWVR